jgi:hypothetical protein
LKESIYESDIYVLLDKCPLNVMKKLTISPFKIYGIESGFGTMLSTNVLSNISLTFVITGDKELLRS